SSRSCTLSNVVKRPPQSEHTRRRRIAAFSSDGRLSFTWLSSLPQNGQRIAHSLCSSGEGGRQWHETEGQLYQHQRQMRSSAVSHAGFGAREAAPHRQGTT